MKKPLTSTDHFHLGIIVALGIVYQSGHETVAEEIVGACDGDELVRIAKQEGDSALPSIRRTIRFLKARRIGPWERGK